MDPFKRRQLLASRQGRSTSRRVQRTAEQEYQDRITRTLNNAYDQILPGTTPEERTPYINTALRLPYTALTGKNMEILAMALYLRPYVADTATFQATLQNLLLETERQQEVIMYVLFLQQVLSDTGMPGAPDWSDLWLPADLVPAL